ncbi:MAG: tetratricopeptide repeat protein [Planctomycetota bacterium]
MSPLEDPSEDPATDALDDSLDGALEGALLAAYAGKAPDPMPSVLEALRARVDADIEVDLVTERDVTERDGGPASTPDAARRPESDLGRRYRVGDELARGGVGVVLRGRDVDLRRDVAMKLLRDEHAHDPQILARFVEEAQVAGQLQHPGIVPVYELGIEPGGRPFIVMKLVRGRTLASILAAGTEAVSPGPDPHTGGFVLDVFERVCETMAYVHARGVVHRDLKPANVMVGAFGEVQVVDWGFAKVLRRPEPVPPLPAEAVATTRSSDEGAQSVSGSVMGTPAYMAPEQARGDVDQVDARADVFSLGSILCEILAGRPAYVGKRAELLRLAALGDLGDAHRALAESGASTALVQLARRCLSSAPTDRPADAGALAAALRAHRGEVAARARRAEVEAAEARVRVRAARRLAVTIVAAVALGAVGWLSVAEAAASRRALATQLATRSLEDAREAYGQVRAATDPSELEHAHAAAQAAATLARADGVVGDVRERAEALLATVGARHESVRATAASRTRAAGLLSRLLELRVTTNEDVAHPRWPITEAQRLDGEYRAAFATYGVDVDAATEAEASAALQEVDAAAELAATLDHWALARRTLARGTPAAAEADGACAHLHAVAARLDANPWRQAFRRAVEAEAPAAELLGLAGAADVDGQPALSSFLLGMALLDVGAVEDAVASLDRGARTHPGDFLLWFWLGIARQRCANPDVDAILTAFQTARALRPDSTEVQHRMGMVLEWRGDATHALRVFEALARIEPENDHWQLHVGGTLSRLGRAQEAAEQLQRVVAAHPDRASAHVMLGQALGRAGDVPGAVACYRRALELDPRSSLAHFRLGLTLSDQLDDPVAALEELRAAFALSGNPEHLWSVASVQMGRGELDDAIASFRQTIELDPRFAEGYWGLGRALHAAGDLPAAIASLQRAIELFPGRAKYHFELAECRIAANDEAGALADIERGLIYRPDWPPALCRRGDCLTALHRYDEAVAAIRRGHELGSAAGWDEPSADWVAQAERAQAQARRWDAVVRGDAAATNAAEWVDAARHAAMTGRTVAAARAFTAAVSAHPELAAGTPLVEAARATLRAATATGGDAFDLADTERAHLRGQALAWLQARLAILRGQRASAGEGAKAAADELSSWLREADFAATREVAAQADWPSEEARAWQAFWQRVGE